MQFPSFIWRRPAPRAGGPINAKNDKDGTVDPDERLRITGVEAGTYDAKLTDVSGRSCLVRQYQGGSGRNLLDRGEGSDLLHRMIAAS